MNILIIGGTGFVGEYISKELVLNDGDNIFVAHISIPKEIDKIAGVTYRHIDFENIENSLKSALLGIDTVVFAIQPDLNFMRNVIEVLSRYEELKKLIYLSTVLVYPDSENPQKEDIDLEPTTEYEKRKLEEERLLSDFAEKSGKELSILRLGNVYGDIKNKGIINYLFLSIINGKIFTLNGDGTQRRDYIYVGDVAKQLNILIHSNQKEKVEIYNVCSGIGYTILDIIGLVESVTKKTLQHHIGSPVDEKHSIIGDNTKFKKTFDLSPALDLRANLEETYKKYLEFYK